MKKKYSAPKVEMIEFDYTETVTASRWPWCCGKTGWDNGESDTSKTNSYWEDTGSSYYNNTGSSYYNNTGSSYWNGN